MKVSFTGLRLTAVAGVLTGHFYNPKKKKPPGQREAWWDLLYVHT